MDSGCAVGGGKALGVTCALADSKWHTLAVETKGGVVQEPTQDVFGRLVAAWRASGLPLGKLLVSAANEYAMGVAVSLHGIVDEALVDMAERYVARAAPQDVMAPGAHVEGIEGGPCAGLRGRVVTMFSTHDGTDLVDVRWGSGRVDGVEEQWIRSRGTDDRAPERANDPICFCPAASEYDPPCPKHGVRPIGQGGDGSMVPGEYEERAQVGDR